MTVAEAFYALFSAVSGAFVEWVKSWKDGTDEKTWRKSLIKWVLLLGVGFGGLWYFDKLPSRNDLPESPVAMKEDVAAIKAELAEIKALLAKKR